MQILRSVSDFSNWHRMNINISSSIGLVATKGYIHEGHLTLIRMARQECEVVVVSIATHPAQFPKRSDYENFPRIASQDIETLQNSGCVDILLLLKTKDCCKYGDSHGAFVQLESDIIPQEYFDMKIGWMEGTMLVKFINLTRPTRVYIGRRDIIRARMLQRMLDDLLYPIDLIEVPTVRAENGVAFDSRLHPLNDRDREAAAAVYRALKVMVAAYLQDVFRASELLDRGRKTIETEERLEIKFIRIAHPYGFQDITTIDPAIGAVAIIKVIVNNKAILLDNVILAPRIPAHEKTLWGLVRSVKTNKKDIRE